MFRSFEFFYGKDTRRLLDQIMYGKKNKIEYLVLHMECLGHQLQSLPLTLNIHMFYLHRVPIYIFRNNNRPQSTWDKVQSRLYDPLMKDIFGYIAFFSAHRLWLPPKNFCQRTTVKAVCMEVFIWNAIYFVSKLLI